MSFVRTIIIGTVGLLLLSAGLLRGSSLPEAPPIGVPFVPPDTVVPIAPVCKGGCTLGAHDLPTLAEPEFRDLLRQFAGEPMSEESPALEVLLFHGEVTSRFLAATHDVVLDAERRAFLDRELDKTI